MGVLEDLRKSVADGELDATRAMKSGPAQLTGENLPDGEKATGHLQVDDIPAFLGRAGFQASRKDGEGQ